MKTLNLIFALLLALTITSCSQDTVIEPPPPVPAAEDLPVRTIADLPADPTNSGTYTFFSFKDSAVVTGSDTTSNKWDIAVRGTNIWINGGTIRYGNGGAVVKNSTSFQADSIAPESGWATDEPGTLAIPTGSGNGWYSYDPAANLISPIPGTLLFIKTGDGKYVKMEITSYYSGSVPKNPPTNSRYYTFRYVYQPDGSRDVK